MEIGEAEAASFFLGSFWLNTNSLYNEKWTYSYLYYLWPLCLQTTKTTTTNHDAVPPPKAWVCCRLARTECVNRAEPIAFFSCRIINIILRMIKNMMNIMANMPNMMKEDNWPVKASTISLSGLPGKWQIFLANLRHNNILRQNIFGKYSWHICDKYSGQT